MNRIANLVELGRRPNPVRYVWIMEMKDGSVKTGATWMMLKRAWEESDDVKSVKFVDLVKNKVHLVQVFDKFLQTWREHYFDPNWQM